MTPRRLAARFERLREPLTGRPLLRARARGGTGIWIAPTPGRSKRFAMLTARVGSTDVHLPDGERLPDGLAHFLEHQMFQSPAGDVFELYAARGASANAFTTTTHTSYLFGCTRHFGANLETLCRSLAALETTPSGVEREKGIIGQEIAMYADDAAWRGWFDGLGAIYKRHPARVDIAGTVASIAPIDEPLLRRAHAAFYAPRNLVLTVVGDVDPAQVLEQADDLLGPPRGRQNRRRTFPEPRGVRVRQVERELDVARPHVLLGLKDVPPGGGKALLRRRIQSAVVVDVLFGHGGRVQAPLYDAGMVDDGFYATYEAEADHAHAMIGADVDDVGDYRRHLTKALRAVARSGISEDEVERARRRTLGRHLRTVDAPERLASWMLAVALEGTPLHEGLATLRSLTARSVTHRMRALLGAPRAWSTVRPPAGTPASS